MVIGVTDNMGSEWKWQGYIDWLHRDIRGVECKMLSYNIDNAHSVRDCDALLLTGGGDVDPALYGGNHTHSKLGGVDRKRDDFERTVIDHALRMEIPILGVCRGLQIANVHLGGKLLLDVEESGYVPHQSKAKDECRHPILIEDGSLLAEIAGELEGNTNSYHHQAVAEIAPGLRRVAASIDGVIEALEFEHSEKKPFFLLIQWHPERMKDFQNPLSQNILHSFLSSIHVPEKERQLNNNL